MGTLKSLENFFYVILALLFLATCSGEQPFSPTKGKSNPDKEIIATVPVYRWVNSSMNHMFSLSQKDGASLGFSLEGWAGFNTLAQATAGTAPLFDISYGATMGCVDFVSPLVPIPGCLGGPLVVTRHFLSVDETAGSAFGQSTGASLGMVFSQASANTKPIVEFVNSSGDYVYVPEDAGEIGNLLASGYVALGAKFHARVD